MPPAGVPRYNCARSDAARPPRSREVTWSRRRPFRGCGSSGYARRAPSGASRSSTPRRGHATSTSSRDRRTRSSRISHRPSWRTGSRRRAWTHPSSGCGRGGSSDDCSRHGSRTWSRGAAPSRSRTSGGATASISPSMVGRTLRRAGIGTARRHRGPPHRVATRRCPRSPGRSGRVGGPRQRRPRARGPSPAGGRDRPPPVGGRRRPFRTRPRGGGVDPPTGARPDRSAVERTQDEDRPRPGLAPDRCVGLHVAAPLKGTSGRASWAKLARR